MGNMRNQGPLGLLIPSNGKYYHLIENKLKSFLPSTYLRK